MSKIEAETVSVPRVATKQMVEAGRNVEPLHSGPGDIWAAMVAAAPAETASSSDLLEALQQVMEWVSNWDPNFIQDPEWPETESLAKSAIAKAEDASNA